MKTATIFSRMTLRVLSLILTVFLTGQFLAAQTYYSQGGLPVNEPTSWNTVSGGGGTVPLDFTGTHTWIIQSGHDMTMTGNWTVGGTATVTLNGSLAVSGAYQVVITGTMAVNGTLVNSGTYAAASAVTASSGITVTGVYEHARDGGYLPSSVWNNGSACIVTGWTGSSSLHSSFSQSFYNFTWNCPGQTANVLFNGNVSAVSGTFNLISTGSGLIMPGGFPTYMNYLHSGGSYQLTNNAQVKFMTVTNDFSIVGGIFTISGPGYGVVDVGGDFSLTGGTVVMSNNFYTGDLWLAGHFSCTAGTITETSVGTGFITFDGVYDGVTGMQTFSSGGTITEAISFVVSDGSYLQMAAESTVISGGGTFELFAGATLGVRSTNGIAVSGSDGNIHVTGTRTYNTGANFIYNGSASQITGDGLSSGNPANLEIDNIGGAVTLSTAVAISGMLTVNAGSVLNLAGYALGTPEIILEGGAAQGSSIIGTGTLTPGGGITVNRIATGSNGASISCPVALSAPRTFSVADDGSAATDLTISGTISGSSLIKTGDGTLLLSGSNTFTGGITVTSGTVQTGITDGLANTVSVILAGGTFGTGATTGYSDAVGTLALSQNSTITLGTGDHTLGFSNSSSTGWTSGTILTVTGWSGTPGASGSEGKISFGSSSGLTAEQLEQIQFLIGGNIHPAVILGSGEVVPNEYAYLYGVAITPITAQSFCDGSSGSELTVAESGGGPITVRQWGKRSVPGGPITPISGATGQTFTPTSMEPGPGIWYVVCTSTPTVGIPIVSNEVFVTTSPLPGSEILAGGPLAFCSGGSVTLTSAAQGNAIGFNIPVSYVEVPDYSELNPSQLTLEVWVYPTSTAYQFIFVKGDFEYTLSLYTNGVIYFGSRNSTRGFDTAFSGPIVPLNTWSHIACTHDGSVQRIYFNGELVGSNNMTGLWTGDTLTSLIGIHPNMLSQYQFNGNLDELRIWSVAKTQEEIVASMNLEVSPEAPNLAAYFKFNESTGTTALNSASPDNSGTLVNNPTWVVPSTAPILFSYLWSTGETTRSINVNTSGTYGLTVTNSDGCVSVGSQDVTVWAPGTWTGTAGIDWSNPANWCGGVPGLTTDVIIPDLANEPVIGADEAVDCHDLTVQTGAVLTIESGLTGSGSLIVHGNATGDVTYKRILREGDNVGDKHLFSAPVGGQSVPDFILDHSTKIDAVRVWDEPAAVWSPVATPEFMSGQGYNIQQTDVSDGVFSFTGSVVGSATMPATSPYAMSYESRLLMYPGDPWGNLNHELPLMWALPRGWTNWGGGGWNLLGNPFTSAMSATDFIADNLTDFDPFYRALYVYDGVNVRYLYAGFTIPSFPEGGAFGEYIQAGQGFMVLANNNGVNFDFDKSLQAHGTTLAFLKSANTEDPWPGLQLKVAYGNKEGVTTVVYNSQMTPGLDPGYDVGQLSTGPEVEIYTAMAGVDNGVNLTRQALPTEGADRLFVPVGIDTEKGGEVTFSAMTVPLGDKKFWLEDRTTGIFTDLSLKSYTVTLTPATYGTGRFFIVASANTPTGINSPVTDNSSGLRIWPYDGKIIIKGEVSENALCEIYDLPGRKIHETRLTDRELNTVTMPAGTRGIFIIRVIDGSVITVRKVIFP